MIGNEDGMMGAKKKSLEELLQYLNGKDDSDLGDAIKPKGLGIEAVKVEGLEGEGDPSAEAGEPSPGVTEEDGSSLPPEELEELIEALQAKLGG